MRCQEHRGTGGQQHTVPARQHTSLPTQLTTWFMSVLLPDDWGPMMATTW